MSDINLESKIVGSMLSASWYDGNNTYGGSLANRFLDDAHGEICKLTPQDRRQVLSNLAKDSSYQLLSEEDGTPRGLLYSTRIYLKTDDCKD